MFEVEIRHNALKMALEMTYRSEDGFVQKLDLPEVLNAAAAFELFMVHGESAVPHGDA